MYEEAAAARATNALGTDCFSNALRAIEAAERDTIMVGWSGARSDKSQWTGRKQPRKGVKREGSEGARNTVDGWMGINRLGSLWQQLKQRFGSLSSGGKIALRRVGKKRTPPRHGFSFDTTLCRTHRFRYVFNIRIF